jgi:hypothetical protein
VGRLSFERRHAPRYFGVSRSGQYLIGPGRGVMLLFYIVREGRCEQHRQRPPSRRRSRFTPIEAITVTWWRKEGDEFRAAMRERNRSKLGRMARLRGEVEIATTSQEGRPSVFSEEVRATDVGR